MQYPGLKAAADADLATLSLLSALAARAFPDFDLGWLYKERRRKLNEELGAQLLVCAFSGSGGSIWFVCALCLCMCCACGVVRACGIV